MSGLLDDLFTRRLLIVTGKGGTGKTSLAAALAKLAAERGARTVLVETALDGGLGPLVSGDPEVASRGDGREPVAIGETLGFLSIDPLESLQEYLEIELRVRALAALVVRNSGFRRLMGAAPGWRELITLGKLWHLESRRERGAPRFDLIVVDAPATGHGLSFLSVPRVVVGAVRLGPLHRHTRAVQELLTDPARTLVVPVTLAEELPVRETLELLSSVRDLGLASGPAIANAVEPAPRVPRVARVRRALERLAGEGGDPPALADPRALAASLDHASRRAELQRGFLARLREALDTPLLEIPYLNEGVRGPEQVAEIARHLAAAAESA